MRTGPLGESLYTFESEVFRKYLCSRNRPLCCEKIAFNSTRRRNFLRSCLTENLSIFLKMGTKFKPYLRTDISESENGNFSGMLIPVLRLSGDGSLVF